MRDLPLLLLTLLVALSPTQLGARAWPEWSLVNGVRVDYLSPTLYLTDVLIVCLLGLFLAHRVRSRELPVRQAAVIVLVSSLLLLGAAATSRPLLSLYWLSRYFQLILVAKLSSWVLARTSLARSHQRARIALAVAILFSLGVGVLQIATGRTTGVLWWAGERSFTVSTPGISTITVFGRELLRPYATFPHPNALAGWLGLTAVTLWQLRTPHPRNLHRFLAGIAIVGVVLTGSRSALIGIAAALAALAAPASSVAAAILFPPDSVPERQMLAVAALRMVRDHPINGVGPGQFLVQLPNYLPAGEWLLQPVHNIPLLFAAEFGIVGIAIAVVLTAGSLRRDIQWAMFLRRLLPIVVFVGVTGMLDHYWVTAQQNRILLGVILGGSRYFALGPMMRRRDRPSPSE